MLDFFFPDAPKLQGTYEIDRSYDDTVYRIDDKIRKCWVKQSSRLCGDGIVYVRKNIPNGITFLVRRYNYDIPNLEPFVVIKVLKAGENKSLVSVFETEYSLWNFKNFNKQVPGWLNIDKCM